jgi:brefeldin A-inhibited guanine nucleotide-exchange protein
VDRIIDAFSIKFHKDNSNNVFASGGAVYSLSYLMMMLQTNLHSPQVVDKMKIADIVKLSKGMNDGGDFNL